MAMFGFPIYISIILCLTVKIRSELTKNTEIPELKDLVDFLADKVISLENELNNSVVRIDNLEKLSNTKDADNTKQDNAMTEAGDTGQTKERLIKALISEKVFIRKSLSVREKKIKDFQTKMIEQMNVINSTIEVSHANMERIQANLNSWKKSQENNLKRLEHTVKNATIEREALLIELQQSIDLVATNTSTQLESVEMKIYESLNASTEEIWASFDRLEYAIKNATIDHETLFTELQQTIDQVATNASTKIESVEMNIYESLPTRTEKIWASIGICPIPFDIDRRLSVKYEMSSSSHLDIREGNTIRNQDYAIFNCSNVIEQKYEPSNRRFQCVRGQWMEADIRHDWKLGNNGAFPECREAICDPPCENDGVCFQDGLCRCEHKTTGERCETLAVCDKISPFYGGRPMFYNDNRREHAVAFLRCDNGYSLYPTGIKSIRCKTTRSGELRWTPEPPLCYKKLKVEVPINCHTPVSSNVELTHKQSFILSPRIRYEFYATKNYLTSSYLTITNNNGTFDPPLPQCVPERCSLNNMDIKLTSENSQQSLQKVAHDRAVDVRCNSNRLQLFNPTLQAYKNDFSTKCQFGHFDIEVNSLTCIPKPCDTKQLAHTKVFNADDKNVEGLLEGDVTYKLTCESEKYVFEDYPDVGNMKRRCEYGNFQNVSSCIEKPCKLLQTDEKLQYRFNTPTDYIGNVYIVQHNAEVFVSCKSDYELYYNRTDTITAENETTITCKYGNMGEIPNCAEKRCKIHINSYGECYQRHPGTNKCISSRRSFIVRSGKTIHLQCKNGYTLEQIDAKANDRTDVHGSIKCTKGKLSSQYICNPDPCQKPELSNATTNYTNTNVTSGDTIVFTCVERHHLSGTINKRTWEGKCKSGTIKYVPAGCIQGDGR